MLRPLRFGLRAIRLPALSPDLTWRELARRFWFKIDKDNVFGRAAELAYFFLFSMFPLLIVASSILGIFAFGADIRNEWLRHFRTALPRSAYDLVVQTLQEISNESGGAKLSLGIVAAIISAGAGMVAVIEGLNTAYEVREARAWIRRRGVAIALTLALALFTILATAIILYGAQLGEFAATHVGLGNQFRLIWPLLQYPLAAGFMLTALALTYRFAPNVHDGRWSLIIPGAVVAFFIWLVASAGLRLYLRLFDTYSAVYGSLGAVIILMLWFYFFGIAILAGGELNSILSNTAKGVDANHQRLRGVPE